MKNKLYSILIDYNLDKKLEDFTNSLAENENITNQLVAGHFLVLTTTISGCCGGNCKCKEKKNSSRNLLIEELKGGTIK